MFAARAFAVMNAVAMPAASAASTSQAVTHPASWSLEAMSAVIIAVKPMTTSPQPETAVNVPARSIVWRM